MSSRKSGDRHPHLRAARTRARASTRSRPPDWCQHLQANAESLDDAEQWRASPRQGSCSPREAPVTRTWIGPSGARSGPRGLEPTRQSGAHRRAGDEALGRREEPRAGLGADVRALHPGPQERVGQPWSGVGFDDGGSQPETARRKQHRSRRVTAGADHEPCASAAARDPAPRECLGRTRASAPIRANGLARAKR